MRPWPGRPTGVGRTVSAVWPRPGSLPPAVVRTGPGADTSVDADGGVAG
jgi:hypothetical protein